MNEQQKQFFEVNATAVLQPANSDTRRVIEYRDGDPVPAPLTSPLARAEYEQFVGQTLPVTFTVRMPLQKLLTLSDSLSHELCELVFNDEVYLGVCDYRTVGASFSRFAEAYAGHVHLQVVCLLEEHAQPPKRTHFTRNPLQP